MKTVLRTITGFCLKEGPLTHVLFWKLHWLELLMETVPPFATSIWLELGIDNGLLPTAFGVYTRMVLNITAVGYIKFSVIWMATSCIFCES